MKLNEIRLLFIVLIANSIENIILLMFFGVKLGFNVLIGSLVFAISLLAINKILEWKY
jgi:hypothetical protein